MSCFLSFFGTVFFTKYTSDFFPCCYSNNELSCGILISYFMMEAADYDQLLLALP